MALHLSGAPLHHSRGVPEKPLCSFPSPSAAHSWQRACGVGRGRAEDERSVHKSWQRVMTPRAMGRRAGCHCEAPQHRGVRQGFCRSHTKRTCHDYRAVRSCPASPNIINPHPLPHRSPQYTPVGCAGAGTAAVFLTRTVRRRAQVRQAPS